MRRRPLSGVSFRPWAPALLTLRAALSESRKEGQERVSRSVSMWPVGGLGCYSSKGPLLELQIGLLWVVSIPSCPSHKAIVDRSIPACSRSMAQVWRSV